MGNLFSSSEIVQMGVQIEENGKDFYDAVASASKDESAKSVFQFLSREEEKHITAFKSILSSIENYAPPESYTDEYFAYLKALSKTHVFTQENKGKEVAQKVKSDIEAIELAIGFEKDSILFYQEMKKFVLENRHEAMDELIKQEQTHLSKLSVLRESMAKISSSVN